MPGKWMLPDRENVLALATTSNEEVEAVLDALDRFEIDGERALFAAGETLREVARKHDELDAKRKEWVSPIKRVAKEIDDYFRPSLKGLKRAEETLKRKIGDYTLAQRRERLRLEEEAGRLAAKGETSAATTALSQISRTEETPVAGVQGVSVTWTGEVEDESQIPREFLVPDVKKLLAVTKAVGKDPQIPGWRAFETTSVRASRRGL